MNIGYSEDVAQSMERLQNDMKKYCDGDMGNDNTVIKLIPKDSQGDDYSSTLPHHDLMIPHWKRLTKAFHHVTTVEIWNICLPRPVLETILPQFHHLKSLLLLDANLMNDELECVSSFLKENSSLERLIIQGNIIDEISAASSFSDSVSNHPKIEKLMLTMCGLDNSVVLDIILEGCKGLSNISFSSNDIGSEGVSIISDFIRGNHPLQSLILDENNISNSDVAILTSALEVNTHLLHLSLENNGITEEGDRILMNALFDATSMNSIVESNHSCFAYTCDITDHTVISRKPPLEIFTLYINGNRDDTTQQKIRKKVILALCGVDEEQDLFDLSHLNDLPLELMPRVLELIQKHSEYKTRTCNVVQLEKEAFSRLFHTLRGWELPLLFENLRNPATAGARKRKRRSTRR